jgi:hypothetical protein
MIFKTPQQLTRRVAMMLGLCAFSFGISSPVLAANNIVLKVGHAATATNTGHLALEFLGKLSMAHQARQVAQGQAPDNFLALEELSNFERSHLKEAFSVVQTLQGVLGQRYAGGRF